MRNVLQAALLAVAAFFCLATSMAIPAITVSTDPLHLETAIDPAITPSITFAGADAELDPATSSLILKRSDESLVAGTVQQDGDDTLVFVPDAPLAPDDYILILTPDPEVYEESGPRVVWFATYSDPRIRTATFVDSTMTSFIVSFSQDMDPDTLDADSVVVRGRSQDNWELTPRPALRDWLGGARHELRVEIPSGLSRVEIEIFPGVLAADGTPMEPVLVEL